MIFLEKLYNGITLDDNFTHAPSDALHVPYLENPPEVIDVSLGRQLFVDDFLIEETTLTPSYHKAKKFEGNPVLFPETPWENEISPCACPCSDARSYAYCHHNRLYSCRSNFCGYRAVHSHRRL